MLPHVPTMGRPFATTPQPWGRYFVDVLLFPWVLHHVLLAFTSGSGQGSLHVWVSENFNDWWHAAYGHGLHDFLLRVSTSVTFSNEILQGLVFLRKEQPSWESKHLQDTSIPPYSSKAPKSKSLEPPAGLGLATACFQSQAWGLEEARKTKEDFVDFLGFEDVYGSIELWSF